MNGAEGVRAEKLDRRQMLRSLLTIGAATVAASAIPGTAMAADCEVVRVGQLAQSSSAIATGRFKNASGGPGIDVYSATHDGVRATSAGWYKSAVYAVGNEGYGVYAVGYYAGVHGLCETGIGVRGAGGWVGVYGESETPGGVGVRGQTSAASCIGVYGNGTTGVRGTADAASGYGVIAENAKNGVGLKVIGRTNMQRSGLATIAAGQQVVVVTVPGGVSASSKYLVTPQGNPGTGVSIQYAGQYSTWTFRIVLNKPATAACKFAWMVLD
jgi:hypothetical protein